MKTHTLKTWPDFFDAVWEARKTFEVRRNDRGFQAGDKVVLREFDIKHGYTDREVHAYIGYALGAFPTGPNIGDHVVFSLIDQRQVLR